MADYSIGYQKWLILAGLAVLGLLVFWIGFDRWRAERDELGVPTQLSNNGVQLFASGTLVTWMESDNGYTFRVLDDGSTESFPLETDATSPRAVLPDPAPIAGTRRVVPRGWLDFSTGETHQAPWPAGFRPQEASATQVYGWHGPNGTMAGFDFTTQQFGVAPPMPEGACKPEDGRRMGGAPFGIVLLPCSADSPSRLWRWKLGENQWTALPDYPGSLRWLALTPAVSASANELAAIVQIDGTDHVIVLQEMAGPWHVAGKIPFQAIAYDAFVKTDHGWLVAALPHKSRDASVETLLTPDVALVWQDREGQTNQRILESRPLLFLAGYHAYPYEQGLIYQYEGKIVFTQPGSHSIATWGIMVLGALISLTAPAWHLKAMFRPKRKESSRKCSECGCVLQGEPFCPACGRDVDAMA